MNWESVTPCGEQSSDSTSCFSFIFALTLWRICLEPIKWYIWHILNGSSRGPKNTPGSRIAKLKWICGGHPAQPLVSRSPCTWHRQLVVSQEGPWRGVGTGTGAHSFPLFALLSLESANPDWHLQPINSRDLMAPLCYVSFTLDFKNTAVKHSSKNCVIVVNLSSCKIFLHLGT